MRVRPRLVVGAALVAGLLSACSADPDPAGPSNSPAPSPTVSSVVPSPSPTPASAEPTVSEPTTTNTLPPPPAPSAPAPSTAGPLTAGALPVPAGWSTVAREGGPEEGYAGNGTWVHAKDPRYAARDLISIGCAPVTRDDYPDPTAALEGSYEKGSAPGVGLVLQFADADAAQAYFERYRAQVRACTDPDVVRAEILPSPQGLIDRRTYPDGDWTEMATRQGSRATFVILSDPGHRMTTAAAEKVIGSITG